MKAIPTAHVLLPPDQPRAAMPALRTSGIDPAVVLAFCLTFAIVQFLPQILNDGDTFWQIKTGEWMLDHRAIATTDPFSFTAGDRRWFPSEWLSEVFMALAFRAGGMQGVMALTAGAVGLTAAVLLHHLRRFLPGPYAVMALLFAFANTMPSLLARPHVLAWPCLALWCGGLVSARAARAAPSPALLPLMAFWVNLHGSFMLGLLLSAAFMIEAVVEDAGTRRQALTSWGAFTLAAFAASLLNPEWLAGVLFPFNVLGMKTNIWIEEWKPIAFVGFQPLEATIVIALALGLSGKVRLPPIRLLMFLGLIHGALAHGRHGQLLGIVGTLIVAEPVGKCLAAQGAAAAGWPWRKLAAGAVAVAFAALAVRIALPLPPDRSGAAFAAALDRVPPATRALPVLNDYGIGGGLIFNGVRPFIDGRADLYGDAFIQRYVNIVAPNRAELERAIADYGIAWAVFRANAPIVQLLDQQPGWRRLPDMNGIAIFTAEDRSPG